MTMAVQGYGDLWAYRATYAAMMLVTLVGCILILVLR